MRIMRAVHDVDVITKTRSQRISFGKRDSSFDCSAALSTGLFDVMLIALSLLYPLLLLLLLL